MTSRKPEHKYKNLECGFCKKNFDSKTRNKNQKYCSMSCGRKASPNQHIFGVKPAWNKGLKRSGMSGRKMTDEHKDKIRKANSGENAPNWKGGVTPELTRLRKVSAYKEWRTSVFERDNYTCLNCKARSIKGNRIVLNADHIKPFALYPELRLDINNGRTLCEPCHRKTPTWGFTGKKAVLELTNQTYEELKAERDGDKT